MIIEKIKTELLNARKSRSAEMVAVLSTLFGEVERVGKDKGNRLTTDEEAVSIIKKFIANNDECIKMGKTELAAQNLIYQKFLPKQLDEVRMKQIIAENGLTALPDIMKYFKTNFAGQYDGSTLSKIAKG